jgi:hypothetical protein
MKLKKHHSTIIMTKNEIEKFIKYTQKNLQIFFLKGVVTREPLFPATSHYNRPQNDTY